MFPPLPTYPSPPAPGVSGGGQVQTNIPPGTLPYKPSIPAGIVGGVSDFMRNFMQMKMATREAAKQQFLEGVQFHQSTGIPITPQGGQKLMKLAKRGGLDFLPTEPPTQQEQDYMQAQQQQAQGQMLAAGGAQGQVPGGMAAPAPTSGLAGMPPQNQFVASPQTAQAMTAGPGPGQPSPSFLQRLKQGLGFPGPVSNQSPMGQWLQNLSQASQVGGGLPGDIAQQRQLSNQQFSLANLDYGFQKQFGYSLKSVSAQNQIAMQDMMGRAIKGDPQAQQAVASASNGWQLPMDEFQTALRMADPNMSKEDIARGAADLFLKTKTGYYQYQIHMADLAKDLAPYYGNDWRMALAGITGDPSNPNTPRPAFSPQQTEQFANAMHNIHETHTTLPLDKVDMLAQTYLSPNGARQREPLMNALFGAKDAKGNPIYPTAGSIDLYKQQQQLGYDYTSLGKNLDFKQNELDWYKIKALMEQAPVEGNRYWEAMNNPKLQPEVRNAAAEAFSKVTQKFGNSTIDYEGKKILIGNPMEVIQRFNNFRTWHPLSAYEPVVAPQGQGQEMPKAGQVTMTDPRTGKQVSIQRQDPIVQRFSGMSVEERTAILQGMKKVLDPASWNGLARAVAQLPAPEATDTYGDKPEWSFFGSAGETLGDVGRAIKGVAGAPGKGFEPLENK